ncbi:uncharacterized protein LOC8287239 isoform X2 [Ricinus communis]|uniref:uncharacterized protein LOC8287239 isoform X2 n=1 Tax=Ricinus communis TaxID=3988 RepID=UPI00201A70A9|nr:uncharacterized protein LOC8287239 isoform X2 [Ricinus communis]
MVLVQSLKLSLPSSSSSLTNSFLFEPNSLSLALMHSDSSISLFPSLSFPSLSSLPNKPQTLVPSPSSSSSFIILQQNTPDNPTVLFLVAGPYKGGSQILFRFFILQDHVFTKVKVVCTQEGLEFDPKLGVLMDANHGVSIKIVGSVNFFVMYSVSSRKVWVFALKRIGDGDRDEVKLMRCAVIDCCLPVWSISVSFGFLILGEDNGVRVFNLRQLVKGNVKKIKISNSNGNLDMVNGKLESKGFRLPNGMVGSDHHSISTSCNGFLDGKIDKHSISVKQKFVRCRQDSGEGGACFVAFESKEVEGLKLTVKAVSIQALSSKKFMILDSNGDLHILCLSNPAGGSNIRNANFLDIRWTTFSAHDDGV